MCLQSVALAGSKRDALLLTFRDAKMCIVEYDPETHDLKTLSFHYFEEEEMKVSIVTLSICQGVVNVMGPCLYLMSSFNGE